MPADDIQAQAPDGSTHIFPAGTADDVVDRTMKNYIQSSSGQNLPGGTPQLQKAVQSGQTPPSQTTKFEQDRADAAGNDSAGGAFVDTLKSAGKSILNAVTPHFNANPAPANPGGARAVAGQGILATENADSANDAARAAVGRSIPYRVLANVAPRVAPVDPTTMEQESDLGQSGKIAGQAVGGAAIASAPIGARLVKAVVSPIGDAVGEGASNAVTGLKNLAVNEAGPTPLTKVIAGPNRSAGIAEMLDPEAQRVAIQNARVSRINSDIRARKAGLTVPTMPNSDPYARVAPGPQVPANGLPSPPPTMPSTDLQGNPTPFGGESPSPRPLYPTIFANEAEANALDQRMLNLKNQAQASGMYSAAQGAVAKKTGYQQRIGNRLTKVEK